jgi:nucleoside-diphosphate-sugar epimerase
MIDVATTRSRFLLQAMNTSRLSQVGIPDTVAASMAKQEDSSPNWFSGKRVLVTGGGGFIAASIIGLLCGVDCQIVRLLRRPGTAWSNPGKAKVEDLVGDIRDQSLWQSLPKAIDVVFHLAAQTSTYEANRAPYSDLGSNVLPMLLMLQTFQERGVKPVVVSASTVTICGLPQRLPVGEDHPDVPITIYDLHKQMAENYLKYYVRIDAVRGAALRLANVYGPGPRSSRPDRGILNQMVGRALRGDALTIYGHGENLRDYVHVEDVASAFLAAAAHMDTLNGGHFIIGRGEGHSIGQALQLVAERVAVRTGKLVPVTSVEPPAGLSPIEARNFVADTRRFVAMTGWRARYTLAPGIDTIIESLL